MICALEGCIAQFDKVGKQKFCSKKCRKISAGRSQAERRKKARAKTRGEADKLHSCSRCRRPLTKNRIGRSRFCLLCADMSLGYGRQSKLSAKEFEDAYGDIE